jgi:16S rRNA (cytosine967-C5)-methyltransferase
MANAVLRKFAALKPADESRVRRERYTDLLDELPALDGSAIVLAEPVMPEHELERLGLATSHPRDLLTHWLKDAPMREVRRLAMHSMCRPPVILNTAYLASPMPEGPLTAPHSVPGHHVFVGTGAELHALLSTRADLWVQDPASALAVQGVADLRPGLVLDLCAGHGTKTRQLARTFRDAKVVATDVDEHRFRSLQKAFADDPQVSVVEPHKVRERFTAKADLVLLDVPCSNTGVLARRPEAKLRFSGESLLSLLGVQKQIIADALPLLSEGGAGSNGAGPTARGRILYSTCSLEPKENAQQVAWADRWHKLGVSRERRHAPAGGPGEPPHAYCDGSFAALLG